MTDGYVAAGASTVSTDTSDIQDWSVPADDIDMNIHMCTSTFASDVSTDISSNYACSKIRCHAMRLAESTDATYDLLFKPADGAPNTMTIAKGDAVLSINMNTLSDSTLAQTIKNYDDITLEITIGAMSGIMFSAATALSVLALQSF